MRVSLCVICGNEAEHIIAMLSSFARVFDELCIVRAIGAKEADATLEMAAAWCRENGKDFRGAEYRNGYGAEKWDHVDSFARARNAAFGKATGDWIVWADCDDLLDEADDFRGHLRTVAPEVLMVRCPYDVRGTNKKLHRERAIRRSAFEAGRVWHHDVHENLLLLPGDKHEDWPRPVWVHAPKSVKKENRRRNLRILGQSVKETPTQYFYIHQEHLCAGNRAAAEQFGKIALSFPNLEQSFRYEALLNLAKLCGDSREAMSYALQAHAVFPWCREAYAAIILLLFEKNDGARARWWAEEMLRHREPIGADKPWTSEAKYYGWAGYDLAARAFRLAGLDARADVLQQQFHLGKHPRISLVHATRGRTSKAVACREAWLGLAQDPTRIEHVFAVDADDKESVTMGKQFLSVVSEKRSCVAAWNLAAKKARGDLIVQLSDDWVPPIGWDAKLLSLVQDRDLQKEPIVIAVHDGHRTGPLLCMAILSRARLEQQGGELFHDGYESVFSDNEFSHRAWRDGIVIDARHLYRFEHQHPAFKKGNWDATYQHNNTRERYDAGLELFKQRNPDADSKWTTP
jgi:glycosyltransferase involved in cell wall biosynthesis